jgi:hypothetical protein
MGFYLVHADSEGGHYLAGPVAMLMIAHCEYARLVSLPSA